MTKKLQTFINRCLWNILWIWYPEIISSTDLWAWTSQEPIDQVSKCQKWRWTNPPKRPYRYSTKLGIEPPKRDQERKKEYITNITKEAVSIQGDAKIHTWSSVKQFAGDRDIWQNFMAALCPRNKSSKLHRVQLILRMQATTPSSIIERVQITEHWDKIARIDRESSN